MGQQVGKDMVAKAKKNAFKFLGLGVVLFVAGIVVAMFIEVAGIIMASVGCVVIIVGAVKYVGASNLQKRICPMCGEKYDYDDIAYTETGSRTTSGTNTASSKVKIRFECHCAKCGYVQNYTKEYTEAHIDKDGNYHSNNIEDEIRRFYSK